MMTAPNAYSSRWFEAFHVGIAETRTEKEVAFFLRVRAATAVS
jgi:hypothetical protein